MDTLAESLLLLTKTNSKVVDKIKELDAKIDSVVIASTKTVTPQTVNTKQKTTQPATAVKADVADKTIVKTVEKPKTVIISDFTKEALNDLAGILGGKQVEAISKEKEPKKEKKDNNKLLKLLGLAGAAALAMKFLFDGEGFTGLIQGFQNAGKQVAKWGKNAKGAIKGIAGKVSTFADDVATKAKGIADDIGKKIGPLADDLATKTKGIADDIGKKMGIFADEMGTKITGVVDDVSGKLGTFADEAAAGLKSSMDNVIGKMGAFANSISSGFKSIIGKVTSMAGMADEGTKAAKAAVSSGSKGATTAAGAAGDVSSAAAKKPGIFARAANKAKAVAGKAVTATKAVAGKALKFTKDMILKPVGSAIGKVKPMKLIKGLAKSPLLAPIMESFFTYKDINEAISKHSSGEITQDELDGQVGNRLIKAITGMVGGAGGAIIGGSLGSVIPVAGNIIGAIAGGVLGDVGGRAVGGLIGKALGPKTAELGGWALSSPLFKNKMQGSTAQGSSTSSEGKESLDSALAYGGTAEGLLNPQEASRRVSAAEDPYNSEKPIEIEDGIITKAGKLIKPHKEDFLYAMKDGGPLANAMSGDNKAAEKNYEILEHFKSLTKNLSIKQIELMEMNNKLLKSIQGSLDESPKSGNGTVVTSNNSNTTNVNFKSPGLRDIQLTYG